MNPEPGDGPDPLKRFDRDLAAFETSRRKAPAGGVGGAADGYRLLGQVLGGVFGGVGFGWLADRYLHTAPWGVVIGLVGGAGLSIVSVIRTASSLSARAAKKTGPAPPVADDDED